eukprot:scaffold7474_cov63-Phaeocystis_antarctica.AAC.6
MLRAAAGPAPPRYGRAPRPHRPRRAWWCWVQCAPTASEAEGAISPRPPVVAGGRQHLQQRQLWRRPVAFAAQRSSQPARRRCGGAARRSPLPSAAAWWRPAMLRTQPRVPGARAPPHALPWKGRSAHADQAAMRGRGGPPLE